MQKYGLATLELYGGTVAPAYCTVALPTVVLEGGASLKNIIIDNFQNTHTECIHIHIHMQQRILYFV